MYKHPEKTAGIEEAPTLDELIEAAAAEADAEIKGKKGSARGQLLGKEDKLLLMLEKRLPLRKQVEVLEKWGIHVTAVSLRNFLIADFPEQWANYLSITRRGQKKNRVDDAKQPQQVGANQEAGKEEEAPAATDQVGRGKQSEETPETATENKPAATGEKSKTRIDPTAIGMSSEERKALADAEARRIENLYNPPKK